MISLPRFSSNGTEVPPVVQEKIDRLEKSFRGAVNNQNNSEMPLGIMDRQRVKVWMRRAYENFDNLFAAG